MKTRILLLVVLIVMLSVPVAYAQEPTFDPQECDSQQLHDWLINRRAYMLATGDVLKGMSEENYPITMD